MMMSITTAQKATIIEIDEKVKAILDNDGTVDNILLGMQAYIPYVIDMIKSNALNAAQLDEYAKTYNGFYTYMVVLEHLALGIQDGSISVS